MNDSLNLNPDIPAQFAVPENKDVNSQPSPSPEDRGPGRPPGKLPKVKQITYLVLLPPQLHKALQEAALVSGRSMASLTRDGIRHSIRQYIKDFKDASLSPEATGTGEDSKPTA